MEHARTLILESIKINATCWQTCSMAKHAGLGRASIHRIWPALFPAPHRFETFKF
jgi:hypothetical protein